MLIKTNIKEIIEHVVKNDIKITDNSCSGKICNKK